MKAFNGIKESADFRAYARGSKCAGCPRWGACATKCKIDAADIKAAMKEIAEAVKAVAENNKAANAKRQATKGGEK